MPERNHLSVDFIAGLEVLAALAVHHDDEIQSPRNGDDVVPLHRGFRMRASLHPKRGGTSPS